MGIVDKDFLWEVGTLVLDLASLPLELELGLVEVRVTHTSLFPYQVSLGI